MKARLSSDISFVAQNGLCTGCGTCAALCPRHAITLEINRKRGIYLPRVNETTCNACGICVRVCPCHAVDFAALNEASFGCQPRDALLGNYIACYTGHAADADIRYKSSSGGVVSALLIFALEKGLIDGALVTRMNPEKPLEPQPFIARTRAEILSASGSKYCPVPANIALEEILKAKEGEKFAVVGLPCHMHGLRKAELVNKKLRERVALRVGLFCGSTAGFAGTSLLLNRVGMRERDIVSINYRGDGWPGHLIIKTRNGKRESIPYSDYISVLGTFFIPQRCQLCFDGVAELADISLGDAWLPQFAENSKGESIILLRTDAGRALVEKTMDESVIELVRTNPKNVIVSQKGLFYRKKKLNYANARIMRNRITSGNIDNALNLLDYSIAVFQKTSRLYQIFPFTKILKIMPSMVIKVYSLPFAFGSRVFSAKGKK